MHAGMAFKPIAMSCKLLGASAASNHCNSWVIQPKAAEGGEAAEAGKVRAHNRIRYSVPAIKYKVSGSGLEVGESFQALMQAQGQQWSSCDARNCLEVGRLPSVDSMKNTEANVEPMADALLDQPCIFRTRRTRWAHWEYSPAPGYWIGV